MWPAQQRARFPAHAALTAALSLVLTASAATATPQFSEVVWTDREGAPLPFQDDAAILDSLRTAEIVDAQATDEGTTQPYQVVLERGDLRVRGIFRWVDQQETVARYAGARTELFFRDRAVFECTAYDLSQALGLEHIPPVVERRWNRMQGSLQIWVEGAMTERQRAREGRFDAERARWSRQVEMMRLFDVLIGNIDRNLGNMLIDSDWRLWLIDHTRAFRGAMRADELPFERIERGFYEGLQGLDEADLRSRFGQHLTRREMSGLIERWGQLRTHFEQLIRERGEAKVVYEN